MLPKFPSVKRAVEPNPNASLLINGLIYSGIFNSKTFYYLIKNYRVEFLLFHLQHHFLPGKLEMRTLY